MKTNLIQYLLILIVSMSTMRSYGQSTNSLESRLQECKEISIIIKYKLDSVQIRYEDLYDRYSELNSNYRKCVSDMNVIEDEIGLAKTDNKNKDKKLKECSNAMQEQTNTIIELEGKNNTLKGFVTGLGITTIILALIIVL